MEPQSSKHNPMNPVVNLPESIKSMIPNAIIAMTVRAIIVSLFVFLILMVFP